MSEVHFLPAPLPFDEGDFRRLRDSFSDLQRVRATESVAVKLHPGEEGNTSFVPAEDVGKLISAMELSCSHLFLTDTTVLYPGRRMWAPDYHRLVLEHGFGPPVTPPFIVADGLHGEEDIPVATPRGFITDTARIASVIGRADWLLVVSHFKGHLLTGFGGTLKNLGMGCASRAGKLYQHSSVKPVIKEEACVACGTCTDHCTFHAITVNSAAWIDTGRCTGCGECLGRCPVGAIRVAWNQKMDVFMRRMVEYAWAALSVSRPLLFVNFVTRVVPDCDCMGDTHPPLTPDIGVLASTDPVALDSACLDLVTQAPDGPDSPVKAGAGQNKFRAFRPDSQGELQLEIAEELGLGSRSYKLLEIRR